MGIDTISTPMSAETVLSGYGLCSTRSIEEATRVGENIFCKNVLRSDDPRFNARIYWRRVGGLGMGRITYNANTIIEPGVMRDFSLVQIPIRGQEFCQSDDRRVLCTPEQGVILNAHMRTYLQHTENTEKLIIRVDQELIRRHCQQHLGRLINKNVEFEMAIPLSSPSSRSFLQMVAWMYDVVSHTDRLSSLLVAQLESTFVGAMLGFQSHNYSRELYEDKGSLIAPSFVKRVEQYIEDHAHEPIGIGDLAEFAGISSRSLFTGFKRFRNTSPMSYLKEVRLRRVREELSQANGTVTAIAFRWGFSHLGHFTTDYKRRFGESPSETLARISA